MFSVLLALLLPWLVRDGMFLDGVTYAAISRNLAAGQGSFWVPHYTTTLYPEFFEHPPLAFGIESIFFRILGDTIATERIYSGITALLSFYLIIKVWGLFAETREQRSVAWMPALMWIITPVVFWSYRNNMIENTLTVMILGAAWFTGKSMLSGRPVWLLPASLLILAAFLTKGPVGLFILVMPLGYYLVTRKISFSRGFWYTAILVLVPVLLFGLISLIQPQTWDSIQNYLSSQVLPSISGDRENTASNRFMILGHLFTQMIHPFFLLLFFILISRLFRGTDAVFPVKTGWFLILCGLAGSLPLMVTLKQHDYYLVPSLPFFYMGLTMLIPMVEKGRIPDPGREPVFLKWAGVILITGIILLSVFIAGKPQRDGELLRDVSAVTAHAGRHSVLSVSEEKMSDWRLIAYLSRKGDISLDSKNLHDHYLAGIRESLPDSISTQYAPVPVKLRNYKLLVLNRPLQ